MANDKGQEIRLGWAVPLSLGAGARTAQLLSICSSKGRRKALAQRCGVSEALLLKWAGMVEGTARHGGAERYVALLQFSRVEMVREFELGSGADLFGSPAAPNGDQK